MRERSRVRKLAVPVIGLFMLVGAVGGAVLWVGEAEERPNKVLAANPGATLLADIERFRKDSVALPAEEAVSRWFELFERAEAAGSRPGELADFDILVSAPASSRSMFAALPPPTAWSAFRAEASRRAQAPGASKNLLAVRYVAEVLQRDLGAANLTLDALAKQEQNASAVAAARATLARLYGDASSQLSVFEAELGRTADDYDALRIPDLVALAGEERARELLTRAVLSGRLLQLESSEPTRRLARRVALANVARMPKPQWSLAHSVEAAPLYEAMNQRFGASTQEEIDASPHEWQRQGASQYYFLAMVIQGRQAEAERALETLQEHGSISIPKDVIEALQRAQMNDRLYRFLDALLQRRPGLPAWSLYIEQAAYTGHGEQALQRVEAALSRNDLNPSQRRRLQSHRFIALLAADRIDQAETLAREMLSLPAGRIARESSHVDAATRAMAVGRLLDRPVLRQLGEVYTRAAVENAGEEDSGASTARRALYSELRLSGRSDEALALARAHVGRKIESFQEAFMRRLGSSSGGDQESLVEIAAIHLESGRFDDVLALLKTEPYWGGADVAQLMNLEDSRGLHLPVILARALEAKGDREGALRVARAAVAQLPGEDALYELIARLDANAMQAFDALFAVDEFEERPLIWKASLQLSRGQVDEAEATIRQAIAIDPSDGEEGPNDRMRAYAVLSRILERQGDASDARLYAGAVDAIRLSEQGDRLHAAGLYQRAFATYREALEKFSDAYCIQSRLAVQLNKHGRRQEALVHYRRAYELMPSSFGRVESHCFGCESVFEGPEAQTLAERVFTEILRKTPEKPQAHYLLAYLREHQGRYDEAVQPLRAAVSLDPRYLNAWKKLDGLSRNTYIDSGERDIARLKMLELDPLRRHTHPDLSEVGDLRGLWASAERATAIRRKVAAPENVYKLEASAKIAAEAEAGMPEEMRGWRNMARAGHESYEPQAIFAGHVLLTGAAQLLDGVDGDAMPFGD